MAFGLGDAVMQFVADQSNLDAAFQAVPAKSQAAFTAAARYTRTFNDELDATGENVRFAGEKILSLTDAFRTLSIQGPERLRQKLDDARNAFDTMKTAGVTASGTLLQAQIKVIERQIAYTTAIGESAVALDAELVALKGQYVALNGVADATAKAVLEAKALAESNKLATVTQEEQIGANELLAGSYRSLIGAFTTLLGAGFLLHFVDQTAKSIDEIDDLSAASGLAVTQIVGLKNAMKEAGDNSDRLGQQLAKIASGLVQAESGSAQQRQAFRALGVEFDAVTGKAPPLFDALLQISDHLHETNASGDSLGLAFKALGRNSVELVSFLSQGSAVIQEQMGHYQDLGDQIQKTVDTGAEFQKLESQIGADIQTFVLPAFRFLVEAFRSSAATILAAKGTLENFGRSILLSGQLIGDLTVGLANFQNAATKLDFSGIETAFRKTINGMRDDIAIASMDMEETSKKAAADAANFLGDIGKAPKQSVKLGTQITPDDNANRIIEEAKRTLDEQLATIEKWKSGIHLAFAQGQIDAAEWQATQMRAADAASLAQEGYLSRLIVGYQQAGEVQKAQAATQELATLKVNDAAKATESLAAAIEKHHLAAIKMSQDWANLLNQNISKNWQDATKAAQELVLAEQKLHEAQTRLAEATTASDFSQQIQAVQQMAAAGVISEEQASVQLKAIYQNEEGAQLEHLQKLLQQQRDVETEALLKLNEAEGNPFFTDAQVANLQKNLDAAQIAIANTQTQIVNDQASADARINSLDASLLRQATSGWAAYFKAVATGSLKTGQVLRAFGQNMVQSIASSVSAAVMGSNTFAGAMGQIAKSALAALAGEAVVQVVHEIAWVFKENAAAASDFANPAMAWHAPFHIAAAHAHAISAAKWGAIGIGSAIAGAAIPSGGGSDQGSPAAPANLPPTPATSGGQTGQSAGNVPRLALGGLVSSPTLAVIGDSLRAGRGAREAILPLDDTRAMDAITGEIVKRMPEGGGGTIIHQHYYIKGDVIDHAKLIQKQSRMIKKGRARAVASEALRVTKRA